MSLMQYNTCCVSANGNDINEMQYSGTEITRRTFLKRVDRDSMRDQETMLGYTRDFVMSNDWHVRYYKGTYRGKPCVYFVHSAIEYIFT